MPKWIWWIIAAVFAYNMFIKEDKHVAKTSSELPSYMLTYTMPKTFHGYSCTSDCSGHEAGYNWAEEHDIDDEDRCGGNSQSFIEGCKAYVEQR